MDDQELVRAGFRVILSAQADMVVVGEAGDGAEALRVLRYVEATAERLDALALGHGRERCRAGRGRQRFYRGC